MATFSLFIQSIDINADGTATIDAIEDDATPHTGLSIPSDYVPFVWQHQMAGKMHLKVVTDANDAVISVGYVYGT